MPNPKTRPTNPGLIIHHDPRNERYLLTDTLPRFVARRAGEPAPFVPKTKRHRQYRRYDQGPTPMCTGFGSITYLATANPFNVPPISGQQWYEENVKRDRANGLFFDGGATVTSAMETGRAHGYWPVYRWIYDVTTMQRTIVDKPVIAGTRWYPSMFERDAEGIVRMPSKRENTEDGHLYTIGAYDAKRDLWDVEQTWEPYPDEASMPYKGWVYRIPGELMYRLVREEGEIAVPDEIKLPRAKAA